MEEEKSLSEKRVDIWSHRDGREIEPNREGDWLDVDDVREAIKEFLRSIEDYDNCREDIIMELKRVFGEGLV